MSDSLAVVAITVKDVALLTLPSGEVMVIGPRVAPNGTDAVIRVSPVTVKEAAWPLNFTDVAPVNPEPTRVTRSRRRPDCGAKLVSVGPRTVKRELLTTVPPGVVTMIGPLVAPAGTVAAICVSLATVKRALTPSNLTDVALARPVPVSTMVLPTMPLAGEKPRPVGGPAAVSRGIDCAAAQIS